MRRISTCSLSNQDISSSLLISTYTANADQEVFLRVFVDAASQSNNYAIRTTMQLAGTGAEYLALPVTTASLATGSALMFVSTPFPMANTDVTRVYITGGSGDTTTPDTKVEIWEQFGASAIAASTFGGSALDATVIASTALNGISVTAPTTVAATFPEMLVQTWRRFFKKSTLTSTELKTYGDNGTTVVTTQTVTDDNTTQTQGAAT